MVKGNDFLLAQVNNAVMQHKTFLKSLEDHEGQADDMRFRDLCTRTIPMARDHQRMLEDYQKELGGKGEGTIKHAIGVTLGAALDLADAARVDDFLRLVADIVMSRQAEDTFKAFRDAGKELGNQRLAGIGEMGEKAHDVYNREANRLVKDFFVEHVRGDTDRGMAANAEATA